MTEKAALDLACNRLAILIKTGKSPVDYNQLWRDFAKKKSLQK